MAPEDSARDGGEDDEPVVLFPLSLALQPWHSTDVVPAPAWSEPHPATPGHGAMGIGQLWTPPELIEACATALRNLARRGHNGPIGVTSTTRGEGRTTLATGLAVAYSYGERRPVLLVELDVASPSFATQFGVHETPGIAEVVRGEASIRECVQEPNEDQPLGVVTAGDARGNPGEILSRLRSSHFLRDLPAPGTPIIADLPPLSESLHAPAVAALMETVLLAVRSGAVPVKEIRTAFEALDVEPLVFLNAVTTAVPRPFRALLGG